MVGSFGVCFLQRSHRRCHRLQQGFFCKHLLRVELRPGNRVVATEVVRGPLTQRLDIEVLCIVVVIGSGTFAVSKPHCFVDWKIIIADVVFNRALIFLLTKQFLRNHARPFKILCAPFRVVASAIDAINDKVAQFQLSPPGLGLAGVFQQLEKDRCCLWVILTRGRLVAFAGRLEGFGKSK